MFGVPFERKHRLFVMSGPSGVGKSTVTAELFRQPEIRGTMDYSVSVTTRPPRPGETPGESYNFVSPEKFDAMIAAGEFLEWAPVHTSKYGTPHANLDRAHADGKDLYLEIDVQGAINVKKAYPDAVLIFLIAPPEVFHDRLVHRPSKLTGEALAAEIEVRMNTAHRELDAVRFYDYCVMNEKLDECVKTVISIITAERCHVPVY